MKFINIIIFVIGLIVAIINGIFYRQPMGIAVGVLFVIASGVMYFSTENKKTQ